VPSRLGPRFAIEGLFLILVAVAVGLADLQAKWIVVTMAGAWLLASAVELAAAGTSRWPLAARRAVRRPGGPQAAPAPGEAVSEPPVEVPPAPLDAWEEAPPPPPVEPPPAPAEPPPAHEPAPAAPEPELAAEPPAEEPGAEAPAEPGGEQRPKLRLEPLQPRPSRRFWDRFRRGGEPEEKGDGEEEPSSTPEEP
jgi:protein TonB